jgi:hypothetical protein
MTEIIIPTVDLKKLRTVGDTAMDRDADALFKRLPKHGEDPTGEKTEKILTHYAPAHPLAPDPDMLMHAQRLFARHGTEIAGALLLAALPQSYAAVWGSRVLVAQAGLRKDFVHRIAGTAQFLLLVARGAKTKDIARQYWTVGEHGSDDQHDPPWLVCLRLRARHMIVRRSLRERCKAEGGEQVIRLLGQENCPPTAVPLNQEDLLTMLLTFSHTVFEVFDRYGIPLTSDDREAFLHLWDVIGCHLAIGQPEARGLCRMFTTRLAPKGWIGLRPPDRVRTAELLEQLRRRLWLGEDTDFVPGDRPPAVDVDTLPWRDGQSGQILVQALLSEIGRAMPGRMRRVPILVVRQLAPEVVRRRLLLGGGGVFSSLADLPKQSLMDDPLAPPSFRNDVDARTLHALANDVTRRAVMSFLRSGRLAFPDLDDWSDGLGKTVADASSRGFLQDLPA